MLLTAGKYHCSRMYAMVPPAKLMILREMSEFNSLISTSQKSLDVSMKCCFHYRCKLYVYDDVGPRYKSHPLDLNSSLSGAMVENSLIWNIVIASLLYRLLCECLYSCHKCYMCAFVTYIHVISFTLVNILTCASEFTATNITL